MRNENPVTRRAVPAGRTSLPLPTGFPDSFIKLFHAGASHLQRHRVLPAVKSGFRLLKGERP